jgi:hypothetical protein
VLTVRRVLHVGKRTREEVTAYGVIVLQPDPDVGSPAVRLVKADGSSYDLIQTEYGWTCECRDFESRRRNVANEADRECKHIRAVLKAGVLADRGDAWEG